MTVRTKIVYWKFILAFSTLFLLVTLQLSYRLIANCTFNIKFMPKFILYTSLHFRLLFMKIIISDYD